MAGRDLQIRSKHFENVESLGRLNRLAGKLYHSNPLNKKKLFMDISSEDVRHLIKNFDACYARALFADFDGITFSSNSIAGFNQRKSYNRAPQLSSMKKYIIPALVIAAAFCLYAVAHFYIRREMDYWQRPWAYNKDENAPLLVGKWQGSFKDPDGVVKEIKLEILVPETDSARWARVLDLNRKRDQDLKRNVRFEGTGLVKSKLGTEYYELSGLISDKDDHQFALYFHTNERKKTVLPNFSLSNTDENARWEGNKMNLVTSFSYYKANNVLSYNTSDPRHMKIVTITLNRVLRK